MEACKANAMVKARIKARVKSKAAFPAGAATAQAAAKTSPLFRARRGIRAWAGKRAKVAARKILPLILLLSVAVGIAPAGGAAYAGAGAGVAARVQVSAGAPAATSATQGAGTSASVAVGATVPVAAYAAPATPVTANAAASATQGANIVATSALAGAAAAAGGSQAAQAGDPLYADVDALLQRWNLNGYLNGYPERKFSMGESVTRGQMAYFVMNFANRESAAPAPRRADIPSGAWYGSSMEYLLGAGLMPLIGGAARPDDPIARQDAASLLLSAFALDAGAASDAGLLADAELADADGIDGDKLAAARLMVGLKLIEPVNGQYFLPQMELTFHELLSALDRLMVLLGSHPELGVTYKNRDLPGRATVRFYDDLAAALAGGARLRFQDESLKAAYYKARSAIKKLVPRDAGAPEKVALLHDYLVLNARYASDIKNKPLGDSVFSPYGVLIKGEGGCESYAKAFQIMLFMCGIENMLISGTADGVPHLWNLVRLDRQYYHVDVTWDDPQPDVPGKASRYFLNVTDEIMSDHHEWDRASYPACTSDKRNPYVMDGAVFDGLDGVGAYLREAFEARRERISIRILGHGGALPQGIDAILRDAAAGTDVRSMKRYEVKDCVDIDVEYARGQGQAA